MQNPVDERQELAGMLHDDVLQSVIAARWALDDIDPEGLPPSGAAALVQALRALEHTQDRIRERIVELSRPAGEARREGGQAGPDAGPPGGAVR